MRKLVLILLLFPVMSYSQEIKKNIFATRASIKEYRKSDVGKSFYVRNIYLDDRSILILRGCDVYVMEDIKAHKTAKIKLQAGARIFYYGKCKIKSPSIIKVKKKINKL